MSETKETHGPSKLKLTYIVTAVAISCLMVGASIGMVINASTPGIPTVIEPGSMVSDYSYLVFENSGTYFAKNGTTGAIDFSDSNALPVLNNVMNKLPNGAIVYIAPGTYSWSSTETFVVNKPSISLIGFAIAEPVMGNITPVPASTILEGNVSIQAENIQLRMLQIHGNLELSNTATGQQVAQCITMTNIDLYGQLHIVGRIPTTINVPYSISFTDGIIQPDSGDAIYLDNTGADINHIYITRTWINMMYGSASASAVKVYANGPYAQVSDVQFVNDIFCMYQNNQNVFKFTGNASKRQWDIIGCVFEIGATGVTFMNISAEQAPAQLLVGLVDTMIMGQLRYLVYDAQTSQRSSHEISFVDCNIDQSNITFYSAWTNPQTAIRFDSCRFQYGVQIWSTNPYTLASANFVNCIGINPRGILSLPVHSYGGYAAISLLGNQGYFNDNQTYTIYDVGIFLTASSATYLLITIKDGGGNVVFSGSSVTRTFIPAGYQLKFSYGGGYPSILIEGN